jgi:hypothetical protein
MPYRIATAQAACGVNGNGLHRRAIQMGVHDGDDVWFTIELTL